MNFTFSQKMYTSKGVIQFDFLKIHTVRGIRYFVTAMDDKAHYHLFAMEQVNYAWTILDKEKVPDWIIELEEPLAQAIQGTIPSV